MYEKIVKWWQAKNIKTSAELAEVLNGQIINLTYHSGNIENPEVTYSATREILENGTVPKGCDFHTATEIYNAGEPAIDYILFAFDTQQKFDECFIKKLQETLTINTYDKLRKERGEVPGEYKKGEYVTGKNETGALAADVPFEMAELIDDIQDFPKEKVLTVAAFFHAKFENIHPFADGNGRTGRLAMNYLLFSNNHPPIIVHQEDRKAYFSALEKWDDLQELTPLIDFLKEQTVKTWSNQFQKANIDETQYVKYTDENIVSTIKESLDKGETLTKIQREAVKYINGTSYSFKVNKFKQAVKEVSKDTLYKGIIDKQNAFGR